MKASLGVFLRNRPDGWQKHHLLEEPVEPSAACGLETWLFWCPSFPAGTSS